jgi:hypothetical protein
VKKLNSNLTDKEAEVFVVAIKTTQLKDIENRIIAKVQKSKVEIIIWSIGIVGTLVGISTTIIYNLILKLIG